MLVRWGKRFKHGRGGIRPNLNKALESFLKGAARGSAPAMVDAGLIYWEMGWKEDSIAMYKKAAELGDPAGICNLGISHFHGIPFLCNLHLVWFSLIVNVRDEISLCFSIFVILLHLVANGIFVLPSVYFTLFTIAFTLCPSCSHL